MSYQDAPKRLDTAFCIGIYLILGAVVALFTAVCDWRCDAAFYGFVIPEDYMWSAHDSYRQLLTFPELWESTLNHYSTTNGRAPVHIIVQLFCGFGTQRTLFTAANVLAWICLAVVLCRLAGASPRRWRAAATWGAVALILFRVRFDPPFQINYVWTAAATGYWLLLFFRNDPPRRIAPFIALALFSFLAGWTHEAFAFPIGGAVFFYWLRKRARFSAWQWTAAICFAAGALCMVAAPGNYLRVDDMRTEFLTCLRHFIMYSWMMWAWLALFLLSPAGLRGGLRSYWHRNSFPLTVALLSIAFAFLLRADIFNRGTLPAEIAFAIMAVRLTREGTALRGSLLAVVLILAACVAAADWHKISTGSRQYGYVARQAALLPLSDSIIWYPDSDISRWSTFNILELDWQRWSRDVSAPRLRRMPEALRAFSNVADTNALRQLDARHWLCIQSKTHPARFISTRRFGIGALSMPLGEREIRFIPADEIWLAETDGWRAVLYAAFRPMVTASVRMEIPDSTATRNINHPENVHIKAAPAPDREPGNVNQ